ncbi:MAG TPA: response regulator transcription factor [Ignavibacteriaceae bacterium]|nr:response regulator transcription factor [Ignavibacteriaceae bacterium]
MKKIRLLLIEDNRLLREGILAILKSHGDFRIFSSAGNHKSTIMKIHELKPNVILLDLALRSRSSLDIVEIVKKEFPKANIVIIDLAPVQADIVQYVKAGASGFILKDSTLDDFLITIKNVAAGTKALPRVTSDSLFSQIVEHALRSGNIKLKEAIMMTKREREVIKFVADGLSNKEIAKGLHVSTNTVRSHIHNIMEKLALHTRLEIANYTYNEGSIGNIAKEISTVNSALS